VRLVWQQFRFSIIFTGLAIVGYGSAARGGEATEVKFTIPGRQSQPFITQIVVKSQGRIVLDASSSPRTVEVTLLLRRPDGTVASRISGKGGNLSLTYFATRQEVNDALAAGTLRWSVEISKAAKGEAVSGRLRITHPEQ
jgi:hypothetical protein